MSDKFEWTEPLIAEYAREVAQDYKKSTVWTQDFRAEFSLMAAFKQSKEHKWFVVPCDCIEIGWKPIKQHAGDMGGYADARYFDTEDEAIIFVLFNNPVLSLQDIIDATISPLRDYENNPHFLALKTLAQYKISQK